MEKTGPDKEDCTCPICMYIMIEPVTMPCKHSLCMPCYKQTVEKSNLTCPVCRLRISVWARKASKSNSLIDKVKWEVIKKAFPEKVHNRLEGNESFDADSESDSDDYETQLRKLKELSKPGEIRQEYEAALEKLQRQKEEEARKEEEASAALIRALQQQELREMEELERQNEELERIGREAAEQLQQDSSPNSSRLSTQDQETSRPMSASKSKGKPGAKGNNKVKSKTASRPTSTNLTMETFFNSTPRSVSSAPPDASGAQMSDECERLNKNSGPSPYPYACISPQDKIFYGLSPLTTALKQRSDSSSSDEAPGLREHSYTTASARHIDLTTAESDQWAKQRSDVRSYDLSKVKSEPEDIFGPGPSGVSYNRTAQLKKDHLSSYSKSENNLQFQPILSCQRTPPKHLANGSVYDPPLVRAVPRNLNVDGLDDCLSKTSNGKKSTNLGKGIGKSSLNKLSRALPGAEIISQHEKDRQKDLLSGNNSVSCAPSSQTTALKSVSSSFVGDHPGKQSTVHFSEKNARKDVDFDETAQGLKVVLKKLPEKDKEVETNYVDSSSEDDYVTAESNNSDEKVDDKNKNCEINSVEDYESVGSENETVTEGDESCDQSGVAEDKDDLYNGKKLDPLSEPESIDEEESDITKDKSDSEDDSSFEIMSESGSEDGNENNSSFHPSEEAISSDLDEENDLDVTRYTLCQREDSENTDNDVHVKRYALRDQEVGNCPAETEGPLTDSRKQNIESKSGIRSSSNLEKSQMKKMDRRERNTKAKNRQGRNKISRADSSWENGQSTFMRKWCTSGNTGSRNESSKRLSKFVSESPDKKSTKRVCKTTLDSFVKKGESVNSGKDKKNVKTTKRTNKNKNLLSKEAVESDGLKDQDTSNERKRKVSNSNDDDDIWSLGDMDQSEMTQEEIDHHLAIQLQDMYAKLDKKNISVDRFKGAENEYSLRKKRKLR